MNDGARQRVFVLRVLIISLVATLLGRLWYVQILSGPSYKAAAQANNVRQIETEAPRGEILDDEGRPLARDVYEYVVTVDDDTLAQQADKGKAVLTRLAPVVGESVATLQGKIRLCGPKVAQPCYTGSPYEPVPIKVYATSDTAGLQKALVVEEKSELFPGIALGEQQVRVYPYGALAGQELGYLGPITSTQLTEPAYKGYLSTDLVGDSGLEEQYDRLLRGTPSVQNVSVNAAGQVTGNLSTTQPVPGDDIVTNLDATLENDVDGDLESAIQKAKGSGKLATTASAIVLNVQTGGVLAMASLPDYDPNEFTGGISAAEYAALNAPSASEPLISRAFSAAYPPGSTFKISSASTILQDGLSSASALTSCPSSFPIGNSSFGNFESESKGDIDIDQALQYSCDTYFYQFAYRQWLADGGLRAPGTPGASAVLHDYFAKMALAYGYGSATGIDLPNESSGVLLDRAGLLAYWEAEKAQYCKGATLYPSDPAREAADAYDCTSGYELQGGDAALFAIGQGQNVLVTPLQQIMAYAALANGGTLLSPEVAKAVVAPSGKVVSTTAPKVRSHLPITPANQAVVRQGFQDVVQSPGGTAAGAGFPASLDVAGKTGTADTTSDASSPDYNQPESWFVSYQPASHPKYAVLVMVEHAGQGADVAAPTAAKIYDQIYGMDGYKAVWPGGQAPTALPTVSATGAITAAQGGLSNPGPSPALPGGTPDPVAVAAEVAQQAAAKKAAAAAAAALAGSTT